MIARKIVLPVSIWDESEGLVKSDEEEQPRFGRGYSYGLIAIALLAGLVTYYVRYQPKTMTDPITGMEFVSVPKGCFQIGSLESERDRDDDEDPVHKACVDSFQMGKYEVTQGIMRAANRGGSAPDTRNEDLGFRLVLPGL